MSTATDPADAVRASGQAELDRFHALRRAHVTGPTGPLALVQTQWIDHEQPVWGVPGRWAPAPAVGTGLLLTAEAADGVEVDGELVDGTVLVAPDDAVVPGRVRFGATTTGTVVTDDDGSSAALRVWDSASEGVQRFGSISAYPYDPDWVITAEFVPTEPGTEVDVRHQADLDLSRPKPLPGLIRFERDGTPYELAAFPSGTGDRLQLVFGDATNGDGSYSVGRFLFPVPAGDGTIVLDLNRAVLPPCAFSYAFNCPVPPAQNRFTVPIEAGERHVLDREGRPLH
ncbi:DUF1684 domain-containing protein [Frigoribacterium salinisoli]